MDVKDERVASRYFIFATLTLYLSSLCAAQTANPTSAATPGLKPAVEITMKEREDLGRFGQNLPSGFVVPADGIEKKLLKEYGAVFVCRGGCVPPTTIVYRDQTEVAAFQKSVESRTEMIGGAPMTLQAPAMKALLAAIADAAGRGLTITPRDVDSATRSYDESIALWASRVEPALAHWVEQKKITEADAERIRSLSPYDQVGEVLKLEKRKIYFSKDLQKSVIYSVAPPGTSQHLSMLAFDVAEYDNPDVRTILATHGWYQTVVSDLPHFTYLGVLENELKGLGLKKVKNSERVFWVPKI
jgi:hypothetical protein